MSEFLEDVPQYWKHKLILASVPKDGTPFEDSFGAALNRPLRYWAQVYAFVSPLAVRVEACGTERRLLVAVSVRAEAQLPCARCLEPADAVIEGTLRYFFSLKRDVSDEKAGKADGDEEIILLDAWEDEIDLAPLIWEVLITSLPATALCSPDCKGLCPECGTNLNKYTCDCKREKGDPRFDALRFFKEKGDV